MNVPCRMFSNAGENESDMAPKIADDQLGAFFDDGGRE